MAEQADLIFTGGPVYTVPAEGRVMIRYPADNGEPAAAAAVRDGRIIAVGTDPDVAAPGREPDQSDRAGRPPIAARLPGRARAPGVRRADHAAL